MILYLKKSCKNKPQRTPVYSSPMKFSLQNLNVFPCLLYHLPYKLCNLFICVIIIASSEPEMDAAVMMLIYP